MKEREFQFRVCFGEGRQAYGAYTVSATNEDEAQEKALQEICTKLYDAFPELGIDVSVELSYKGEM